MVDVTHMSRKVEVEVESWKWKSCCSWWLALSVANCKSKVCSVRWRPVGGGRKLEVEGCLSSAVGGWWESGVGNGDRSGEVGGR